MREQAGWDRKKQCGRGKPELRKRTTEMWGMPSPDDVVVDMSEYGDRGARLYERQQGWKAEASAGADAGAG
jgi:hypothetical protein